MPPRRPRPSGLTNLGSTCYFNSVVQALYALHTVTDALASQHPNDFGFAFELARVFAQMGSLTDFRPVDTQALFSLLKVRDGPRDKFASPHVQEDAAECLEHVLVMTGFVGLAEMRSLDTTTCSGCRVASSVPGEASMLEIRFTTRSPHVTPLSAMILSTLDLTEELRGDNLYACPGCPVPQPATRQLSVTRHGKWFVVHLVRFQGDAAGGAAQKICDRVSYDKDLTLPIGRDGADASFSLCAAVMHVSTATAAGRVSATTNSGHYITFAKHRGSWFKADDRSSVSCSGDDVADTAKMHGYLLLYHANEPSARQTLFTPPPDTVCAKPSKPTATAEASVHSTVHSRVYSTVHCRPRLLEAAAGRVPRQLSASPPRRPCLLRRRPVPPVVSSVQRTLGKAARADCRSCLGFCTP